MTPTSPVAPIELGEITNAQIGRASDRFAERCRTNATSLPKVASQQVLEDEGDALAQEMFEAFRKRVERRSKVIVRHVKVNRDLTPEQMIAATGRKQDIDAKTLTTMPRQGIGTEEFDMYFVPGERYLTISEQEKLLADYGLTPDYYGQTQVTIDDPSFADEHPNGAQWDNNGKDAAFVTFYRWGDERYVVCHRNAYGWHGGWWFAGRRKS